MTFEASPQALRALGEEFERLVEHTDADAYGLETGLGDDGSLIVKLKYHQHPNRDTDHE